MLWGEGGRAGEMEGMRERRGAKGAGWGRGWVGMGHGDEEGAEERRCCL